MKKIVFLLLIVLLLTDYTFTQNCNFPTRKKVLLVGDSWGNFMWIYRNYKESFIKYGYPDYIEEAASTTENGAEAEDFLINPKLANVINALNNNPDIDLVLISLGGNDILGDTHKNFTQAQNDSILDTIQVRLSFLIDTIKNTKPNVQILISGYDYPNFGETCFLVPTGAYADLFADMGSPSFSEINGILILLMQRFAQMAQNDPQLNLVSNLGLMQYVYGQSNNLIVPPYLPPYPPYTVPLPGGNINYPSPRAAMLANIDAFHLNQNAYQHFANRHTEEFFWHQFRKNKDTSFVSMGGQYDGFIDANASMTYTQLAAGNTNATGSVSSILTFNTEAIPDNAIITAARIFLTRSSLSNQNPIVLYGSDNFMVDIKNGHFGINDAVETDDFSAIADAYNIACVVGTAESNNHKIRIEITDSANLQFINKTGLTQFRLSVNAYDSLTSNVLYFYNSIATNTNMPILDIKYTMPVNNQQYAIKEQVEVYPNPTSDVVFIKANLLKKVELHSIDGKLLMSHLCKDTQVSINISHLQKGIYVLSAETNMGIHHTKIVVTRP